MKKLLVSSLSSILLLGCASNQSNQVSVAEVTDYASIDHPIKTAEKFYTLNISELSADNSSNSIVENELLEFIANDLERKGFARVTIVDSSDFIVTIHWQATSQTTQGYTQTLTLPTYNTSTTTASGYLGSDYLSGTSRTTSWSTKDYQFYIPPITYHPQTYILSFLDSKDYMNKKISERYRAESKYDALEENALVWAPEHIQKILETFQHSDSNQTGYVGLGFNTSYSQPTIYAIDPYGPAAQKMRFLKGKKLVEIGETKIRYRTQAQKIIKNSKAGTKLSLSLEGENGAIQNVVIETQSIPSYYQIGKPYF